MRAAGALLLGCALVAAGAAVAQPRPEAPDQRTRVYGIEVESSLERDRLLVFADGLLRPKLVEVDRGTVMLSLPGARLDPTAPTRLAPGRGAAIRMVTVFETADEPREVRITVLRSAGVSPSLSQRGGQVALDFERPGQVTRATPSDAPERTLEVRWLQADPGVAIEELARFLDRRVVIDAALLRGTVSVEAQHPLDVDEAAALFDTLLLLKGLAAVEAPGDALKIVQLATMPGRWVEAIDAEPGGAALLTLVRLEEVDAELAVQALEPLVGPSGLLQVYPVTNAVMLGGPQSRLARIVGVLRELDAEGATRVVLIPLEHADAVDTAEVLRESFGQDPSLRVWPDERTQRLIVRARHRTIERLRAAVARIDRPPRGGGRLQVVPVQYSDPQRMATLLRDLAIEPTSVRVAGAESLAGRDFAVSVHAPTHSLVVQSDPETIDLVREILARLDQPPASVLVEVGVTELLLSDGLELAFDALVPFTKPRDARDLIGAIVSNPSGALLETTTSDAFFGRVGRSPIVVPVVDPTTGETVVMPIPRETAVLTANAAEINSRVLVNPRLLLLSGEEHEIFAGNNIPVPTATAGEQNALRVDQTIERRDVGVRLRVQPTVPEDGPIVLELDIDVSALSGAIAGGPTFVERTLEAVVRLDSGASAVIGSSRQPRSSTLVVGMPFLSRIPILGWLFRRNVDLQQATYTLITVKATRQHRDVDGLTGWMLKQLAEQRMGVAAGIP